MKFVSKPGALSPKPVTTMAPSSDSLPRRALAPPSFQLSYPGATSTTPSKSRPVSKEGSNIEGLSTSSSVSLKDTHRVDSRSGASQVLSTGVVSEVPFTTSNTHKSIPSTSSTAVSKPVSTTPVKKVTEGSSHTRGGVSPDGAGTV